LLHNSFLHNSIAARRKTMNMTRILAGFTLVVLIASIGLSQYYARESFNYAKGTSIDTLMGTASNGWGGPWYKITTSQKNAAVAADTGYPYTDLSYAVPHVGKHLESMGDSTGTELRWGRNLATTWPDVAGQKYWISVLMDVKNATDNATWIGVKFYNGATSELGMLGKGHGMDKYTCGSGWHGSPGPEVSSTAWTTGPVWLVGEVFMKGAGNYDPIYMWINPDPNGAAPDTSIKDAVTYTSQMDNGINVIRIEFGGTVGLTGLRASFDEIRLGSTWGDVSGGIGGLATGVLPWGGGHVPSQITLNQNYPNPFNPGTNISYTLKTRSQVILAVYDILGRQVATLVNGVQNAGEYQVPFSGAGLTSGVYFYRLTTTEGMTTKKMVLLK
jgi:hypothetical protein